MKIAIIADIHGNYHGLEALLSDIEHERPEMIVGAGDMAGCSLHSSGVDVLRTLSQRKIPVVRGNHEEYILSYHDPAPNALLKHSIQFMPAQYVARQFSSDDIAMMRQFPVTLRINGPAGDDVVVCHASPTHLSRSYALGIDAKMGEALQQIPVSTIVGAHTHTAWHGYWQGKLLLVAGSGGLPFGGLPEVEYLLLEHYQGGWTFRHKRVPYDASAALDVALSRDFLKESGPMGWLMLDEALSHEDTLTPFFRACCADSQPNTLVEWENLVRVYLQKTHRWEIIGRYISDYKTACGIKQNMGD